MKTHHKILLSLAALTLSAVSNHAQAREAKSFFAGGDYVFGNYGDSNSDGDASFILGRFGWFIDDSFSIEGRIGLGLEDNDSEDDSTLNTLLGAYGAYHFSKDDVFNPYLLGGYTKTDGVFNNSTDESDFSYGVGANIRISKVLNFNIGWTSYTQDLDGVSLGLNFRF